MMIRAYNKIERASFVRFFCFRKQGNKHTLPLKPQARRQSDGTIDFGDGFVMIHFKVFFFKKYVNEKTRILTQYSLFSSDSKIRLTLLTLMKRCSRVTTATTTLLTTLLQLLVLLLVAMQMIHRCQHHSNRHHCLRQQQVSWPRQPWTAQVEIMTRTAALVMVTWSVEWRAWITASSVTTMEWTSW